MSEDGYNQRTLSVPTTPNNLRKNQSTDDVPRSTFYNSFSGTPSNFGLFLLYFADF